MKDQFPWARKTKGFTLVEVTMAVGVVTFALLSIMGLFTVGLTTLRASIDETLKAQIVRQISSEVTLTPYQNLLSNDQVWFFDPEGRVVSDASGATLKAEVIPVVPSVPGSVDTNSLINMQIRIESLLEANPTVETYNIFVANAGQ